MMHGTHNVTLKTLQYDARYTQRHINSLQYDARYTQRQIPCLIGPHIYIYLFRAHLLL